MYGLLGEHLQHSYSPQIHKAFGGYDYELFEVAPPQLESFLRTRRFDGLNVTIPYKKAVIPYLSELSEAARAIGAVNTITVLPDGGLRGENTDYDGFLYMVQKSGVCVAGKKVLVLGTGGASLPVRRALETLQAGTVLSVSRTGENNYQNINRHFDAQILVNTTPVGMYPHNLQAPLSLEGFSDLSGVLDLIYNPHKTRLLLEAEKRGIPAVSGLSMLVAQAKRAAELFLQTEIPQEKVETVYQSLLCQMQNIVLVGMPGCGKSTVGKALAEALSRPFYDADAEIVRRCGISIPEIFETQGEAGFRKIETEVLSDLCRQSSAVIATGGGAVTVPENFAVLRQNSKVVWLTRDVSVLPTAGRPLSRQTDLREMLQKRTPFYQSVCDVQVDGNAGIQAVVDRIMEVIV